MFLLFGAKTVKTPVKNGLNLRKHCDRCRLLSDMQEHISRQYFTLFFIPVFPISRGESSLVCNRCGASFIFRRKTISYQRRKFISLRRGHKAGIGAGGGEDGHCL